MPQKLHPRVRLERRHLPERVLQATGVLQTAETHLPGVGRPLLRRWVCQEIHRVSAMETCNNTDWLRAGSWDVVEGGDYNTTLHLLISTSGRVCEDISQCLKVSAVWNVLKVSSEEIIQLLPRKKRRNVSSFGSISHVSVAASSFIKWWRDN